MEEALIDWGSDQPVVLGEAIAELPPEVTNCVLFRTSGSSGLAKWVALSRESLEWSARAVIGRFSICADDVLGLALPTHHVGGFGVVARAHFSGACLKRYEGKWAAHRFVKWVEGVTVTSLVPTQVSDLVRHKLSAPPSLRVAIVGGGVLSSELKKQACLLGWPVLESYGMTETSSQVATGAGLPLMEGWDAKVLDGRLALRGGGLLRGYLIDGVFHDPKREGWFLTQDRALLHDRSLEILGRADRQVKVLGELVDLDVLERRWEEKLHCDLAIVTQPDARRGVNLLLVTTGAEGMIEDFNASLPGPERISAWRLIDALPRSALGKINREKLNQIFHL